MIAWHARTWNGSHAGIELAHGVVDAPIDDTVLWAGAWECANWVRAYQIPLEHVIWAGFAEHREVPPGIEDGKVDVSATTFDMGDFLGRVRKYL